MKVKATYQVVEKIIRNHAIVTGFEFEYSVVRQLLAQLS